MVTPATGGNLYGCPLDCVHTKYGCCSDGISTSRGPYGAGCLAELLTVDPDLTIYEFNQIKNVQSDFESGIDNNYDEDDDAERVLLSNHELLTNLKSNQISDGNLNSCSNSKYECCPDGVTSALV